MAATGSRLWMKFPLPEASTEGWGEIRGGLPETEGDLPGKREGFLGCPTSLVCWLGPTSIPMAVITSPGDGAFFLGGKVGTCGLDCEGVEGPIRTTVSGNDAGEGRW